MAMIFPGMDPYLENPAVFPGIHAPMVVYLGDQLAPLVRPRHIVSVGERVYIEGRESRSIGPDVWLRRIPREESGLAATTVAVADEPVAVEDPDLEVHEPYIAILDRQSGMRVVTVIELVSPRSLAPNGSSGSDGRFGIGH